MRQATFSKLRNYAKYYFDLLESGEPVRIVRNGKPIADIVPLPRDLPSWKRRVAKRFTGHVKGRVEIFLALIRRPAV